MVDKSGGAKSHRDPPPSGENWRAAGVTSDRAGQAGGVQRSLLARELIHQYQLSSPQSREVSLTQYFG